MNLKWEEPVEFSRALAQNLGRAPTRTRQFLNGAAAAIAVALLTWAFEWFFFQLHQKDLGVPGYFYIIAALIAAIFVFFLPMMVASIPARILLNERGVQRIRPIGTFVSVKLWTWDSISTVAIDQFSWDQQVFPVLIIQLLDQSEAIRIGLPNTSIEQTVEEIRTLAQQLGKHVDVCVGLA